MFDLKVKVALITNDFIYAIFVVLTNLQMSDNLFIFTLVP